MKIAVVGGGPGGLYFSILTKMAYPEAQIEVFERNKADDSFGFGVVFSDETLSEFLTRDPKSYSLIRSRFAYWDELDVSRDNEITRITGNGFCGCSRKMLLQLLQQRCTEEGVKLHFEHEITSLDLTDQFDLVVAADGIGSKTRDQFAREFGTEITLQKNKFVWCGSTKPLDAFTYFFRNTEHGPIVAHTYQYEEGKSTWIFECTPETWTKFGFEIENEADSLSRLAQIFETELDGHGLISNRSHWRQFPHVVNKNWHHKNIVLLGDAKATAHYSIGSGTKLAMESAIALSDAVVAHKLDLKGAFAAYEKKRRNTVEKIQYAAKVSLEWFENMDNHIQKPFYAFAFGVMSRAKKVSYENLQLRDSNFTQKVQHEFVHGNNTLSPAFQDFKINGLTLENRIGMSAMGQYCAVDGSPEDWHFMHYASRAIGGLGYIITEATAISPEARIGDGCTGIYSEKNEQGWKRIIEFIHTNSTCKIGIQLAHAGRKASSNSIKNKGIFSASPIAWDSESPTPKELDRAGMTKILNDFMQGAIKAVALGFDFVEIQAHHGFLLGSFLSPLTNQRSDLYGGEGRSKFPLEVIKAVRNVIPAKMPLFVRISACDWAPGGISTNEIVQFSKALKSIGVDLINVSTGNTVKEQKPATGRMWQAPFSELVKSNVDIPTICAGSIENVDQINTLLINQKADLISLGKPLLANPHFVAMAKMNDGIGESGLPFPYNKGDDFLKQTIWKSRKEMDAMRKALKPASHSVKPQK
ncbi:MAG: anthraniloyl-CoA monooxygenase [Sphingobacteriales bacterium]|jgi:anthraniloyl-CoA monooxygenase